MGLLVCLLAVGCLGGRACADPPDCPSSQRPNVIWILLDACRAQNLSCYGYERTTSPNIDSLATQGAVFLNHFAQGNQTRVSVPSYVAGRYFATFCLSGGGWRETWRKPSAAEQMIPTILKQNGYRTGVFSAHPWLGNGESRFYREFEHQFYCGGPISNLVKAFLEWLGHDEREPFFAYFHASDTHFPHRLKPPYNQWVQELPVRTFHEIGYIEPGARLTDVDVEVFRGLHDGSILSADGQIGQIVDGLKAAGVFENTVVIVGADHGDALAEDYRTIGHNEGALQDEVIRVPLIMKGPGIPGGRRVEALTENVDIVPTVLELAGVESDASFDGTSLTSLMREENSAKPWREYTVTRAFNRSLDDVPILILRDTEFKYIYNPLTNEENLWRVPDRVASRELCTGPDFDDERRERRTWVEQNVMPKWQAYAGLARVPSGPFIEYFGPSVIKNGVEPADAVVRAEDQSWQDNRWSLMGVASGALVSSGWQEDAPAVSFGVDVPSGTYRVEMEMHYGTRMGHPASAFLFSAEGEPARVICSDEEVRRAIGDNVKYRYMDIGTYEVPDGRFDVTLDEADNGYWAVARSFKFTPVGAVDMTVSPHLQEEQTRQLEALGYLE